MKLAPWLCLTICALYLVTGRGAVQRPAGNVSGLALGIFERFNYNPGRPPADFSRIGDAIGKLGHTPAIILGFYSWALPDGTYRVFPKDFADYVTARHSMPMITWQPGRCNDDNQVGGKRMQVQPEFNLAAIASGRHDAYIAAWADAARAYPHTVYVRLMHEMNEPVYPWSYGVNGNKDGAQFVAAWRHVVDIFHRKHVSNVQFVWCVGAKFGAQETIASYFPGDEYTDWVSIDGYNRNKNGTWDSIADIFERNYAVVTKISGRPVMIAETGCVEDPKDPAAKPQWITDGFLNAFPKQMPRVKAILYFDNPGKGFTYPLASSPESYAAFKALFASPLYQAAAPSDSLKF
jgi:hypothetical protein